MAIIYRIVAEADRFAYLDTADREAFLKECPFDGTAKPAHDRYGRGYQIDPPEFFVAEHDRPRPDIWSVCGLSHALAIPRRILDRDLPGTPLVTVVEAVGQFFSIEVEGEEFVVWVVTNVLNALDKTNSRFDPADPGRVLHYEFHSGRVGSAPFRIMETRGRELLAGVFYGECAACDQFVPWVQHVGLTGLRFEEIWNDGERVPDDWDECWEDAEELRRMLGRESEEEE
ncbi:MAG: hypothetical protein WED34_07045 [Planctomycetales bacterium]